MDSSMNEIIMELVRAFLVGGIICALVQVLLDRTKMMPGRVMVTLVVTGNILGWLGLYEPFLKWAGAGAGVPLLGFGNTLWTGVAKAVGEEGPIGIFRGGLTAASAGIAAALVFVVGGTLLTKDSLSPARTSAPQSLADSYDYDYDTYTSDVGYSEEAGSGVRTMMVGAANDAMPEAASAKSAVAEDKKIIRNVSLTIKTSAYDDSMASLTALLSQYGGYLESSSEYTNNRDLRTASLTLRIPADSLDAFLSNTGELGRVTSRNMSSTDVTASYQDTAARLENQKLLLARLQALTDTAGDLSDLLALETQLADTQYNIEQLESALADTDQQVNDATVRVTLNEEAQPDLRDETVSLGERIRGALSTGWNAFVSFLQDCVVFLTAALPFIAIVAVMAIVIIIVRKAKKRK